VYFISIPVTFYGKREPWGNRVSEGIQHPCIIDRRFWYFVIISIFRCLKKVCFGRGRDDAFIVLVNRDPQLFSEAYTLTLGKPLIYTPTGMIDELNGNELFNYPRQS
jgi:hypothetical protein